ncbi:hypothetical protein OB08_16195 [Microbacterium sp. HJ5]
MRSASIHQVSADGGTFSVLRRKVLPPPRLSCVCLEHLAVTDSEQLSGLGLEPMVTASELAEYLRVDVQAIYDLRLHDRGPKGIGSAPVGKRTASAVESYR